MSEETEKFIRLLKTRKATDINDGFMEVTLNIAGRALFESQLILCRFIQNFDFELEDSFEPQLNMTITLNSKNGLRVKFKQI